MARPKSKTSNTSPTASLGFAAKLWLSAASEDEKTRRSVDLLGRLYKYCLTSFASTEGEKGEQFYTPRCVLRCPVEILDRYRGGRIFDPACS